MTSARRLGALLPLTMALVCTPIGSQSSGHPATDNKTTPSKRVKGPHGLEGWTLDSTLPDRQHDGQKFPFTLVIASGGHVIRRIDGDPFIWKWIYWSDGMQIAYETGPLHLSATCILFDIKTGHRIEDFDCWNYRPENAPDWVNALEKPHE